MPRRAANTPSISPITGAPQGIFACVMDSYDYAKSLAEVLPAIAAKKVRRGACVSVYMQVLKRSC